MHIYGLYTTARTVSLAPGVFVCSGSYEKRAANHSFTSGSRQDRKAKARWGGTGGRSEVQGILRLKTDAVREAVMTAGQHKGRLFFSQMHGLVSGEEEKVLQ